MKKFTLCAILCTIVLSCSGNLKNSFRLQFQNGKTEYQLNDTLKVSIRNLKKLPIDSVVYFYDENRLGKSEGSQLFSTVLKNLKLGKHSIVAVIHTGGEEVKIKKDLKLFYDEPPQLYTYKILNVYPHDIYAYTQGLEFHNGILYESTGRHGQSSLRKVDYKTGEILKKYELKDRYFGEGITILNDKIYMLTWRSGKGFVFDMDFNKLKSFDYDKSKEGWGLTHNEEYLFKSDGTEKIWKLDPETLEELSYIQTVTNQGIMTRFNELEWVNGKIYANTYLKDGVAIINPKNGAIIGLIDFRGLREKVKQHPKLDVLNGIAYNHKTETLFVTGKNWNKLFEVKIIKE